MDDSAVQRALQHLFERHAVELDADEDWLLTDGDFPALRASWQDGDAGAPGCLDVDVVLSQERRIELSYAGHGRGEAGCREALERFAEADLHVLLAACWYVTDARRLELTSWDIGLRRWDVFVARAAAEGADGAPPTRVTAALAHAMQDEMLSAQLHWVRWRWRRTADGTLAADALLDNEPWPAGARALDAIQWPGATADDRARGFLVLDVRDY